MKIVHSWLKDHLPLGDDIEAIAETLTDLGLAVDAVGTVGTAVEGVITARVVRTERHPEAAKVHRVYVDAGDARERHVWCGAFNMSAGDVVPLATPGTTMPDGRRIEPKPILGIASEGMLCSARELGLGDDHTGIMILSAETPLGVPYAAALGLSSEVVYDLDVTRNLPDCFGHRGVARQLGARLGLPLSALASADAEFGDGRRAGVEIFAGERCTRFSAYVIDGVEVTESPEWIASRLRAAGMRPINNVVDVSNYVMLELNQPNHAYDLETLGGGGFRIRLATAGETIVTLDGVPRTLDAGDLLICDAHDTPIGIAGVMGGLDSEISAATTTIALEIAHFEPVGIATTARRTGLRSEASLRFERGVDPDGMPAAAARFVELLRLTNPRIRCLGMTDARSGEFRAGGEVETSVGAINARLGTTLDAAAIAALIGPLGLTVSAAEDETLRVSVPSYRPDVLETVDVAEEVARQYGYANVGKRVPNSTMHGRLSPLQARRRQLRAVLLGLGLTEVLPNPFLADVDLAKARLDGPVVRIVNALVAEESVLRTSLRPGLLKTIAFNESHRRVGAAVFEIGRVYPPGDGELPDEYEALGVAIAGAEAPAAVDVWRDLVAAMGFGARLDQSIVPPGMHPTRSATLTAGKRHLGVVGEVHPDVLDEYSVAERVAVLELDLSALLATPAKVPMWKPTSRFPSSDLDLAIVAADGLAAERIDKALRQAGQGLLVGCRLFDVYRGPGVPDGSRSLAYRLRLQSLERTLTESEIGALRARLIDAVVALGASVRGEAGS